MGQSKDTKELPDAPLVRNFDTVLTLLGIEDVKKILDTSTLKKQYFKASRIHHPDKNSDAQATERFQILSSGYELMNAFLSDDLMPSNHINEAASFLQESSPDVQKAVLGMIKNISNQRAIQSQMKPDIGGIHVKKRRQVNLSEVLGKFSTLLKDQNKNRNYNNLVIFLATMEEDTRINLRGQLLTQSALKGEFQKQEHVILMSQALKSLNLGKADPVAFNEMVSYLYSAKPIARDLLFDVIKQSNEPLFEPLHKALTMHKVRAYYSHANQSGSRDHKYQVTYDVEKTAAHFKEDYVNLKGDALKTKILADFQLSIENINTPEELKKAIQNFKEKPEYSILERQQGLVSKKLRLETSSLKAFDRIVEDAEFRVANAINNQNKR